MSNRWAVPLAACAANSARKGTVPSGITSDGAVPGHGGRDGVTRQGRREACRRFQVGASVGRPTFSGFSALRSFARARGLVEWSVSKPP